MSLQKPWRPKGSGNIVNVLKEKNCQSRIVYPAKLSFKQQRERKRYLYANVQAVLIIRAKRWKQTRCLSTDVKVAQSCLTLCDPMNFSRPEFWSGQPIPSPGDLPNLGIESRSPALQAGSLLSEPQGKPLSTDKWTTKCSLQTNE